MRPRKPMPNKTRDELRQLPDEARTVAEFNRRQCV